MKQMRTTMMYKSIPMVMNTEKFKPIEPARAIWISDEKKWRYFSKENIVIPHCCLPDDIDHSPPDFEKHRHENMKKLMAHYIEQQYKKS